MDYQKEYYDLIKEQLASFGNSLKGLEGSVNIRMREQDREISDIKGRIKGMLGWAAGAGAAGGFMLTIVLFLLGRLTN